MYCAHLYIQKGECYPLESDKVEHKSLLVNRAEVLLVISHLVPQVHHFCKYMEINCVKLCPDAFAHSAINRVC